MSLPVGSLIFFENSGSWQALSEHNRSAATLDIQRLEKTQRMSNGTLRKVFIADKNTLSVSWTALPTYSSMTVDGFWGAMNIKDFYQTAGQGVVRVKVSPNNTASRSKEMTMSFTAASFTMLKRNVNMSTTTKSAQITAATVGTSSIVYTSQNTFQAGETVTVNGFESSQFNVNNAIISAATATTFTVPKQKDLSFSITEVSASNNIVTYISNNTLSVGDRVSVTGLATAAFNLTDVKVASAEDYYFTVSNPATGTAITSAAGGTATVISEATVFAITKTEPSFANKEIKFTSVSHKIHAGESVNISGVRQDATITNVEAHTVPGQVKYTAANNFGTGDYINITGMTPSEYNVQNAVIVSATETYFIIAIPATSKFRKSGKAVSILNVKNALVKSVTADTFTVASLTANGVVINGSASAQQIVSYPASAISVTSEPQEFWDVSISLEEV
jgi:hypothetical protein